MFRRGEELRMELSIVDLFLVNLRVLETSVSCPFKVRICYDLITIDSVTIQYES